MHTALKSYKPRKFIPYLLPHQNQSSNYPLCRIRNTLQIYQVNGTHICSQIRGKLPIKYNLSKMHILNTFISIIWWRLNTRKEDFYISPNMHLLGLLLKTLKKKKNHPKSKKFLEYLPGKNWWLYVAWLIVLKSSP